MKERFDPLQEIVEASSDAGVSSLVGKTAEHVKPIVLYARERMSRILQRQLAKTVMSYRLRMR